MKPTVGDTWFRADEWSTAVTPVEYVGHTEKFVTIVQDTWRGKEPRRVARVSDGYAYFPTWEEARDHLVKRHSAKVEDARRQMNRAQEKLDAARALEATDDERL